MPAGHKTQGVSALLFDRLGHRPAAASQDVARYASDHRNYYVYDHEALKRSIQQQLGWLLNTRAPVSYEILDARNRDGARSTLDYGLPDLSAYPLGDPAAMARLRVHLAQTIAFFEPRLHDPVADVLPIEGPSDTLRVEVRGQIRIDAVMTPATFLVDLTAGGAGGR
jgi:type VI secretion system lysozyme-like protein